MAVRELTPVELTTLLLAKAEAPLSEANQLLVRHLQCKESQRLSAAVAGAVERYGGSTNQILAAPPDLLVPLA